MSLCPFSSRWGRLSKRFRANRKKDEKEVWSHSQISKQRADVKNSPLVWHILCWGGGGARAHVCMWCVCVYIYVCARACACVERVEPRVLHRGGKVLYYGVIFLALSTSVKRQRQSIGPADSTSEWCRPWDHLGCGGSFQPEPQQWKTHSPVSLGGTFAISPGYVASLRRI